MCGLAMSVSSDLATLKDHVLSGYAKVLKKTGAEQRTYWKGYVVKFVWACSVWNDEVQVERSSHKQKLLHRHVFVWKQCYLLAYRVCSLIISLQIDARWIVIWINCVMPGMAKKKSSPGGTYFCRTSINPYLQYTSKLFVKELYKLFALIILLG